MKHTNISKTLLRVGGIVVGGVLLLVAPTTGWVAASKVIAIQRQFIAYDQQVIAINDKTYTIKGSAYNIDGIVGGIRSNGEYFGTLGIPESMDASNKTSVRTLAMPAGSLPSVGDAVSLQGNIWTSDPKQALGVEYQDVTYPSQIGDMGAWIIEGNSSVWTIGVHGIGADKTEMLRFIKPVTAAGDTMMIINYRNDANNPESPDGRNNLGSTEWQDLQSAVDYARSKGATNIRLYGDSLGGSIVMNFMKRTDGARRNLVSKIILDSPALNWGSILRNKLVQGGYPEQVYYPTAVMLKLRAGIDLAEISIKPADFTTQTLIIHSADDKTVPQLGSKQAADANPNFVRLVDFGKGGHLRSWNYDPTRYETQVTGFLRT